MKNFLDYHKPILVKVERWRFSKKILPTTLYKNINDKIKMGLSVLRLNPLITYQHIFYIRNTAEIKLPVMSHYNL